MWPGDARSPNQSQPIDFFPWGSTRPKGSFRLDGLGSHGLIPDHLGKNQIPTIRFVGIEGLTNPDFFEDIEVVLYSKKDFIQLLQQNKIMHGVQLGPIYEALIKMGWLQYT